MVTTQEISEIRKLIEHNKQCFMTAMTYDYQDWHSADGQTFSKIDSNGCVIEVDDEGVINNLGVVHLLDRWLQEEGDYDEKVSAFLETEA